MPRPRWQLVLLMGAPFLVVCFLWRWLGYVPAAPTAYVRALSAMQVPAVIAHQGGDGLRPGNTLLALQHAFNLDVDVLELDVRMSADDELVLMHDATVDRTTDGSGAVRKLRLAQLRALDAGYRWPYQGELHPYRGRGVVVPSLVEVLQRFPTARFNIELKDDAVGEAAAVLLCTLLRRERTAARTLVASFHARVLRRFRAECPEVATSTSPTEVGVFLVLARLQLTKLFRSPAQVLQVPRRANGIVVLDAEFVRGARAAGLLVDAWTINTREDLREVAALGISGVITDRPDLALAVRAPARPQPRSARVVPRAPL